MKLVRLRLGTGLRAKLESQDVYQEAFIRAFKGLDGFEERHEGAFLHWMAKLVENVIRDKKDFFAAAKRASPLEVPLEPRDASEAGGFAPPAGGDPTPSRWLASAEEFDRLLTALDGLPQESRDAFVLREIDGLPFAEIGRLGGRSEDAARMLYVRAKSKLSALLGGG